MTPEEYDLGLPFLKFAYSFSPLSSHYEVSSRSKIHFYFELFAVIGAIATFFNLINGFTNTMYSRISTTDK